MKRKYIDLLRKIKLYFFHLKKQTWTHITVWSFFVCEAFVLILTAYETISEQIDLKNGIVPDYIFGLKTYFLINHLLGFMLLGLFEIILIIIFFIFKLVFKKKFLIKAKCFTHNNIYNYFWTFGFYITAIVTFCMAIYLVSISYEGFLWLLDK